MVQILVSMVVSVWTVFRPISVHSDAERPNCRFPSIHAAFVISWHGSARSAKACPGGLIIPGVGRMSERPMTVSEMVRMGARSSGVKVELPKRASGAGAGRGCVVKGCGTGSLPLSD
jgi:hypothetical protein